MKRLRVGVVYGGRSSEHDVSLASAAAVFANLDPDRYETRRAFYESKDGTRVPILVSHRKDLQRNGRNPTFPF